MKQLTFILFVFGLIISPLFAQGHEHNGNHYGMWPDSMETVTLTGIAIIVLTDFMPIYYLDVDNDGKTEYHLSFGPSWYEPVSGATRPNDGETITVIGAKWGHEFNEPTVVVYEINGLKWRKPIEGGMHGWDGDHFWGHAHDDTTVAGTTLIDSSYFYSHYFLDTDSDQLPDFMLNFGPPWYVQSNKALIPKAGDVVTVTGSLHEEEMMMISSLLVYEINGLNWRDPVGPPPWSGNWIHRNAMDTTFVHAPTDSLDWMKHPPGSMMGNMMGGRIFPDSVYCQFEEMYPNFLPGFHDSTIFAGYYMNMYDPLGQSMMGMGGMMGGMGQMRFNRPTSFQFHYDDEHLRQMGLSDTQVMVKYWNENNSSWIPVSNYTVDAENNIITFQNDEMYTYYALFGSTILTGLEEEGNQAELPQKFTLYQNYPNPFNPETTIQFVLPASSMVNLIIYDLLGRKVRTLIGKEMGAGLHQLKWNGRDNAARNVPAGVYLMQLTVGNQMQVKKLSLVK